MLTTRKSHNKNITNLCFEVIKNVKGKIFQEHGSFCQLHWLLSSVTLAPFVSYIGSFRQLHWLLSSVTLAPFVSYIGSFRQLHWLLSSFTLAPRKLLPFTYIFYHLKAEICYVFIVALSYSLQF